MPESRLSRMWIKYLDEEVQSVTSLENSAYVIDIEELRKKEYNTARIIEEATNRFGAERV